MGNFNYHFENVENNNSRKLHDIIYTFNLIKSASKHTHQGQLLDLVFTKQNDSILVSTKLHHGLTYDHTPAPVAQWLARRTVSRKVWGSNPIRVMWDFSALAGSYPELGVLWAQWEGWNHTAELHPLHGCVLRVLL